MPFPTLEVPAILSPMAGVTDVAFRALCKRYGAGMTVTEFVSSAALARGNAKTEAMLATDPSERPVAVQLFGSDEEDLVAAARSVEERFDAIDINCGCPAWKVIKTGAGSALLNDPERVAALVRLLVSAVSVPVTVKIRAGIDERHVNAVEVARAAEAAGAAAIAVHGRTQKQGYRGEADWSVVRDVKHAVRVPVIGNGDVFTGRDFVEKLRYAGCDAIMVARGAIGNPGIFREIREALAGGEARPATPEERLGHFDEYLALARSHRIPYAQVKSHATSFTKGLPGGARLREAITHTKDVEELQSVLRQRA